MAVVHDDRAGAVSLELAVDVPAEFLAFFLVGLGRLRDGIRFKRLVARVGAIALRAADMVGMPLSRVSSRASGVPRVYGARLQSEGGR